MEFITMKGTYTVAAEVQLNCTVKLDIPAKSAKEARTLVTNPKFDINSLEDWQQDVNSFRLNNVLEVTKKR
jgi:hypothetical protein